MLLKDLLLKLQFSENYLTTEELANNFSVSKRTVQNQIHELNKEGRGNGFQIKNVYGKGYYLEIKNGKRYSNFVNRITPNTEVINEKDLISNEIRLLLASGKNYLTVEKIADTFKLSLTNIYGKLDELETYLNAYDVKLLRKSHYGIRLDGSEANIIKLIFDFYDSPKGQIREEIEQTIGDTSWLSKAINSYLSGNPVNMNYYQYQSLVGWIKSFIFYEIKFGDESQSKKVNYKNDILNNIYKRYHFSITKSASKLFMSKIENSIFPETNKNEMTIENIEDNLKDFINQINNKEHISFSNDSEFISKLAHHLYALFNRINKNINYKNPLLMDISIKYPLVFDITLNFYEFLKKKFKYDISNDELGFISLYFLNNIESQKAQELGKYHKVAVICTSGGGISELTKNRISRILPDSIIKTFSFYENAEINKFSPDLILTMVPLSQSYNVPIIFINELLSDRDLDDIKKKLFLDNLPVNGELPSSMEKRYIRLFSSDFIKVFHERSYKKILISMSDEISLKGLASKALKKEVLIREHYMSTVYRNGIAIPHPMKMNGNKSVISVGIVKPSIKEDEKEIRLIFLISLSSNDVSYYSSISNDLYKLMNDKDKIQQIVDNPNIKEIQSIFRGLGE